MATRFGSDVPDFCVSVKRPHDDPADICSNSVQVWMFFKLFI